ncbi:MULTISPECIES: hypothetical protein [Streptomyces]|uniref:Uncharacterized protein n=1 Tax=Streptomyces lichenis TaxID=2306967 RepID=A0ABT0IHI9_9ACTN|nr:hypothetical protein [Streptomyces lichenis]MCK8680781.1 hypothetical protein [Streptomyces lichenis]
MAEADFSATGVRIERWPRSLTRAGEVLVQDGRLALLTSYGRVIDSAPVRAVRTAKPWFSDRGDAMVATLNGHRYRLTLGQRDPARGTAAARALTGRLRDAVRRGGGGTD